LFVDYVAINVFEDPLVAIGILLVWSFLVARWASFFFFMLVQKVFKNKNIQHSPESESYKLSFLFWMYAMLNIILILMWNWSKMRGLIILWLFILLLYFLMVDSSKNVKKSE
jgi:ABC-type xylose transport system permease subunit